MYALRLVLLILHISAAAVLLGGGTGLMRNLRRCAELGGAAFRQAAADGARRGAILGICSLVTLGTGLGLIFMMGGFAVAPKNFHAALTIMLVAFVVSVTVMKPTAAKLVSIAGKESYELSEVTPQLKKLQAGQGILHLLWLTNLILMLIRF